MTMKVDFTGWIANLSNGESVVEGSSEPGKLSPWRQLLQRLLDEPDIYITGLRMQQVGITIHAMTNKSCDGYFHAYEVHRIVYRDVYRNLQGIGAVVDDQVFITWIERGTTNVYQEIRSLESSKIHTTLTENV